MFVINVMQVAQIFEEFAKKKAKEKIKLNIKHQCH